MDTITLTGMSFYGYHGVMPEEQRMGQRFYIDLEIHLPLEKAGITDRLEDTVNYAEVYEVVQKITEEQRYALIEKLAGEIGRQVLSGFPVIDSVSVTVHKPSAPVCGTIRDISVTVETKRNHE